ncbi:hypothetical protein [Pseudanabaena sp. PCC 6802]|uniref:hypothetical protein n=1 Tax=Pseudanabaena sp. PCC 6802 TaxID=118173 RepID=UPI00034DC94D|nr:hypothetical protein [Pseudanabaena sp. PCC 6802]
MKKYVVSVVGAVVISACSPTPTVAPTSSPNSTSASNPDSSTTSSPNPAASPQQPPQPQNQTNSNAAVPANWHSYTSEAGKYSAAFPGKPSERTQDLPSPKGLVKQYLTLFGNDDGAFFVAYNDVPKEVGQQDPQTVLAEAVRLSNQQLKGKIKEDNVTDLDGFPCRSFVFEDVKVSGIDAIATGRTCLIKDRLYQQLVLGNKSKISGTDIEQFIQSFKLAS